MSEADFLIIGAGAAGSVLANRLTASGKHRVVVLEAGEDVRPGHEPADIRCVFPLSAFNERYMWPDTRVHWRRYGQGRAAALPQGRLVGGSSQIMGMWAMRGNPHDYDEWEAGGAAGWGWDTVLPYFKRLETDFDFGGPLHGQSGPLPIRRERPGDRTAIARAIHAEAMAMGWTDIADMNADFRDGHCALPVSREVNSRASAGMHYLTKNVRARSNLDLRALWTAERLVFEGKRIVGAVARAADGTVREVRARTTIVAAGALRSPLVLMRSGIGPPDVLLGTGIPVLHAAAGVGKNLRNHAVIHVVAMLTAAGLDPPEWRPAGSTYLRWTSGQPETPPSDMAMYVRSYLTWHALGRRMASLAPCLMRPASAGQITLQPGADGGIPRIEFDLLSDARDLERMKSGVVLAVRMLESLEAAGLTGPPVLLADAGGLARYNNVSRLNALRAAAAVAMLRIAPPLGRRVLDRLARMVPAGALVKDEDRLTEFIQRTVTGTGHVCGTCKMGPVQDSCAVVDPQGRVHGLPGVMVADASIMPDVPSGNTHVPTIMIAEKIAASLTGDFAR